ncbi:MAG: hypothetical protein KJ072_10570 [Verrucomicrobia bacterium]|nr:hypothetical protein [Verrucomicrobiota bacterium]
MKALPSRPRMLLCVVAVLLNLTQAGAVSLVYDNSTVDLNYNVKASTYEVADQIILGGTDRSLACFGFEYYNTSDSAVEAQVRFYLNDGKAFRGIAGWETPGTVFYDSGLFEVGKTDRSTLWLKDFVCGAAVPLSMDLPDSFSWSVKFTGLGADEHAGVTVYNGLEVGNNYNDYWVKKDRGWTLGYYKDGDKVVPMNFAAQIYAKSVPEPTGALAILIAGLVFAPWLHRRHCA